MAALRQPQLPQEQAKKLYQVHVGRHFCNRLVGHVTSGPVVATVVRGPRAITAVRKLLGSTDPMMAEPDSIIGDCAVATTCHRRSNMLPSLTALRGPRTRLPASVLLERNLDVLWQQSANFSGAICTLG